MVFFQITSQLCLLNLIKHCDIFNFYAYFQTTNQFSGNATCDIITLMPLSVTGDEPKPLRLLSATENVSLTSFQSLFIPMALF